MERTFKAAQAKAFYDRFGAKQDAQVFYEECALENLMAHADFRAASSVFEFGCGTGRFAERLLSEVLSSDARYVGLDISSMMVHLAQERLQRWSDRAEMRLLDGSTKLSAPDASFDGFVSNYVLDLLSKDDISAVLAEAARTLSEDGLLCLVSLTYGQEPLSKLVSSVWTHIHALRPWVVGGCRPVRLLNFLPADRWRITHREVVSALGISSEVVVASRYSTPY